MKIVCDTNLLSSLAAGEALTALRQLYQRDKLVVPPAVRQELQRGSERGKTHLQPVLQAILTNQIEVLSLSAEEELLTFQYPAKLGAGEREAMALAQSRKVILLSNDYEAMLYCRQRQLRVVSLANLLRLFWRKGLLSQDEVRAAMTKMEQVESHKFALNQSAKIFAPDKP